MEELVNDVSNLDEDLVLDKVQELIVSGMSSVDIINILNRGMHMVGQRFEFGEYFLADLIVSGVIYKKALDLLCLDKNGDSVSNAGKILIGVVKNDIHDIGKDIVVSTLKSDGFEVIDLGVDVCAEEFVESALAHRPNIVAIGGTMSFSAEEMKNIIEKLKNANVRDFAKIVVGGLGISLSRSRELDVDGYSDNPIEVLAVCRKLLNNEK